jgi:hypothetical protein
MLFGWSCVPPLFFSLYMGKKRIHAGIAASTSESPATIVMFTHDSMPHYPDTTPTQSALRARRAARDKLPDSHFI